MEQINRIAKETAMTARQFVAGWVTPLTPAIKRILFVTVLICSGCASVGPNEQRLVSKPNMVFSESTVFSYENKLLPQLEPGSAVSGSQTSGCTSCK
jgi:hypothetical protein